MGLMKQLGELLKKGKSRRDPKEVDFPDLAHQDPENASARLKLAEAYLKKGEKRKAAAEYLLAADLFAKNQYHGRALAIYKQLCRRDPSLDQVYWKMAEIYREKGCLADAFYQYRILARHYEDLGEKEKARGILKIMEEIDPQKTEGKGGEENRGVPPVSPAKPPRLPETAPQRGFDLGAVLANAEPLPEEIFKEASVWEKAVGVEEIFKELKDLGGPSAADPHFNYNMGVAYRELGFFDEAVGEFETAVRQNQKPFEALTMLGFCYWEKGRWEEARSSFETALAFERISRERILSVKYILSLLHQERGEVESALNLLQEIATTDKGFLQAPEEMAGLVTNPQGGKPDGLKTRA